VFFLGGMGGGNPRMRSFRIGALVLIVLAGVVLHHTGRAYEAIRLIYFALIIGLLFASFRGRRTNVPGVSRANVSNGWPFGGPANDRQNSTVDTRLVDPDSPPDGQPPRS
jgi:hypothetical protein